MYGIKYDIYFDKFYFDFRYNDHFEIVDRNFASDTGKEDAK